MVLEQKAVEYSLDCFVNNPDISVKESFIAGAEWQKEQYKELIKLSDSAAHELELEGAVTLANTIRAEIERLQTL
jgi:uncharacterized protein (DUF2132 family)